MYPKIRFKEFYDAWEQRKFRDLYKKASQKNDLSYSIDKIISPERKKLNEKDRWTVLSMIVNSDGKMKTEFGYTDIGENAISCEQEWKAKNLK